MVLLARTTRSVSLTDAGRRLVDSAGPSLGTDVGPRVLLSCEIGRSCRGEE
jgi:hypothetical protein